MAKRNPGSSQHRRIPTEPGELSPQFVGAAALALFEACRTSGWDIGTSDKPGYWLSNKAGKRIHVSLERLGRMVRGRDPQRWPELLTRYLETAIPPTNSAARAAGLAANRHRLLPVIKSAEEVRSTPDLWSHDLCRMEAQQGVFMQMFGTTVDAEEATRQVRQAARKGDSGPNLLSVLLNIDLPNQGEYVTPDMVTAAGQPVEKWLQLALRNLRARTPEDWYILADAETGTCCTSVNDGYDAARALILDKLLPESAERGWFVAPVTRDDLYFVSAGSPAARAALFQMRRHAERRFGIAASSLSKEVFWLYRGKWHLFPFVEVGGHPVGVPPVEYQRVFGLGPQPGVVTVEPAPTKKLVPTRIFGCPHCGKPLSARQKFAGKVAKCPACGRTMQVPK